MNRGTVYEFQWDPAKAQSNARKHGVTFDQAAAVFLDTLALTVYDEMKQPRRRTLAYTWIRRERQTPGSGAHVRGHGVN
jgi:uncharacterized DUF497 family protein